MREHNKMEVPSCRKPYHQCNQCLVCIHTLIHSNSVTRIGLEGHTVRQQTSIQRCRETDHLHDYLSYHIFHQKNSHRHFCIRTSHHNNYQIRILRFRSIFRQLPWSSEQQSPLYFQLWPGRIAIVQVREINV